MIFPLVETLLSVRIWKGRSIASTARAGTNVHVRQAKTIVQPRFYIVAWQKFGNWSRCRQSGSALKHDLQNMAVLNLGNLLQ